MPEDASAPLFPPFTLRGRLGAEELRWSVADESDRPSGIPGGALQRAAERAAELWNASGCAGTPRFLPAEPGATADVTVSWARGEHGSCTPFGYGSSVAHSGPVGRPTFVHLDSERTWHSEEAPREGSHSLPRTVAHEFGHLLGLDHVPDPRALMNGAHDARNRVLRLSQGELDGLGTLYGTAEEPTERDLVVEGPTGSCVLRGWASDLYLGTLGYGLADLDGDGDDELAVWREQELASPLAWIDFALDDAGEHAPRPLLVRGPLLGLVGPELTASVTAELGTGLRLWILERADGAFGASVLEAHGRIGSSPQRALELEDGRADVDGDSVFDSGPDGAVRPLSSSHEGDVDGDGLPERVRRGTGTATAARGTDRAE